MNYLQTILAIVSLIRTLVPEIIGLVSDIDKALPQGSPAELKVNLILNVVKNAYEAVDGAEIAFEKIAPVVQGLIVGMIPAAASSPAQQLAAVVA